MKTRERLIIYPLLTVITLAAFLTLRPRQAHVKKFTIPVLKEEAIRTLLKQNGKTWIVLVFNKSVFTPHRLSKKAKKKTLQEIIQEIDERETYSLSLIEQGDELKMLQWAMGLPPSILEEVIKNYGKTDILAIARGYLIWISSKRGYEDKLQAALGIPKEQFKLPLYGEKGNITWQAP